VTTLEETSEALIDYRGKSPPKSDKGIPLITAKNIRMGFINIEPKEYIDETSFDQWMVKGIPKLGDIFFTTEAPLGFVSMVPEYKHAVGQRVITISPRREIFDPHFLCYQFQGETFQKQLIDSSTGSTVAGIKQSTLRKIFLSVVPLSEQRKIMEIVSSIDKRIDQVAIKLSQTQSLKKSLMQDLLTGKVRVTVN
jgi:type I restriction enzyme S subunit